MTTELLAKYNKLIEYIKSLGSVAVAFSSGVDSTFLLYASKEALGDKAIAVTASSCAFPGRELNEAQAYCDKLGVSHTIVKTHELELEEYVKNPPNRCYICKKEIFRAIIEIAKGANISVVLEGSNLDDDGDYRPGLMAIKELGVISPLRKLEFTKKEIRDLSQYFSVPTWDKPSYACLASRFPYGEEITEKKLERVDKSEQLLMDLGFKNIRVRIHGDVARIELNPDDFDKIMEEKIRNEVYIKLKEYGFSYVSLDLLGYRTGSLNEKLLGNCNDNSNVIKS